MRKLWLIVGSVVLVVLVLFLAISGYLGKLFSSSGDPECDELPKASVAHQALIGHDELVQQISGVGPGVRLAVTTPCPDTSRGLIVVSVSNSNQEPAVRRLLDERGGLGVPVVIRQS
ncbi:hypothetical protein [Intrasporangium sp.]|uniref:hypothetical protein n=1 Tax=Intrasporangium sp. TaxID=1925024 RepID=UPI003221FFC0